MVSPLRRLLPFSLRYRNTFVLGLFCVLVTSAVALLSPWILKHAIDDLHTGVTVAKLRLYSGLMLGVALIGGYFRFAMRRLLTGVSRHVEYDLRNAFFAQLERLPLAYFQVHRTGELMSRATNDLNAVRMMIGPAVMYSANTIIVFVVATTLMFSIDARLAAIALIPLPFVTIAVRFFGTAIHKRSERIQEQLAEISAVVQEALAGVRVVRSYGQETSEIRRFERANREYVDRNRRLIGVQACFFPSLGLLLGLGTMMVLWIGGRHVIEGRITVGEFVAFNSYLVMLSWPMIAFGWVTNMLQRGMASWKRMLEVLDAPVTIADVDPKPLDLIRGAIELRDLSFSYDGRLVLDRISVRIEPGQTVAIVGATGAGKSTLLNLLPRLHEPPAGTVFIDGVDVREIPLSVLRGAIGFVPQDPFLFSDTIGENIAFGDLTPRPEAERRERVERAAAIARLDKDVETFPRGYDTMVGERGITLSGGQKQRTAIARAIMPDPPILVLDDAMSAVDTYTEEEILARLKGVMRQRTSIIVSHRVSTVRDADLILVLDNGHIVQRGTHAQLVAGAGFYGDLYRKQLLEEELAAS